MQLRQLRARSFALLARSPGPTLPRSEAHFTVHRRRWRWRWREAGRRGFSTSPKSKRLSIVKTLLGGAEAVNVF